jgi:hypothetical protein
VAVWCVVVYLAVLIGLPVEAVVELIPIVVENSIGLELVQDASLVTRPVVPYAPPVANLHVGDLVLFPCDAVWRLTESTHLWIPIQLG